MSAPRFIDIHVIQSLPPSNINRDDSGSPKEAIYGGVRRARVSSQAWKRAARVYTAERQPEEEQATRTKRLVGLLAPLVAERTSLSLDDATAASAAVIEGTVKMDKSKPAETSYLLFFGRSQVSKVADLVAEHAAELLALSGTERTTAAKKIALLEVLGTGHPVDVALYGRMVADLAALNVDASVQVAHAISTHGVQQEFDYFTAVDDEKDKDAGDDAGAGMIGTVEFNSSTLYRYATVGTRQLAENLGDTSALAPTIDAFVEAFVKSMPTGHQNSFAHRTHPALVVVAGRDDQPVNLVNAFETAIPADPRTGFESRSLQRLAEFYRSDVLQWGEAQTFVAASYHGGGPAGDALASAFGQPLPFDDLRSAVRVAVAGGDPQ